jgi:hypothetical protein
MLGVKFKLHQSSRQHVYHIRVECYSFYYVHFYSDSSRVLLDKFLVTKLIKKRPDFYETKKIHCYVHKSLAKDCF